MVVLFEDMVLVPICIAFFIGVLIGWAWKPKWAIFRSQKLEPFESKSLSFDVSQENKLSTSQPIGFDKFSSNSSDSLIEMDKGNLNQVNDKDLEHLCQLVENKDGGPTWIHMMDRSTPTMTYKAWRRDQKIGPPQYYSSTIFENAMPEIVRDFFWDDEFRSNWDDMLAKCKTIEECPTTGTMIVHWIRKFPFFCKDREYIIGRRIWESGRSYYCVTKGVPFSSIPRKDKPRRVDLYYSSWCIRAVESKMKNGQLSACEVLLFHHEEMGIPWEIAKLGVKKGMWSLVKKIEPSLRSYQRERALGEPLSRMAFMANINTKIDPNYFKMSLLEESCSEAEFLETEVENPRGSFNVPKIVLIGGAIIFACTFDQCLLTKTLIFGLARTVRNVRKRSN